MKRADHYLTAGSEIDVSYCNVVPDAPRITANVPNSQQQQQELNETKRKLETVASTEKLKDMKSSPLKKSKMVNKDLARVVKSEKLLFSSSKKINQEQVSKWIVNGDVAKLEHAFLLGKGRMIIGKATWNDAARQFIKSVPDLLVSRSN